MKGDLMPAAEVLGNLVGENLRELHRELAEARHAITVLLDTVGTPGFCPSCGAAVMWIPRAGYLSEVPWEPKGSTWHLCQRREERDEDSPAGPGPRRPSGRA